MSESLLDHYRALERASGHMLEAAQRGDWTRVAAIERSVAAMAATLQTLAKAHALGPEEDRERLRIMHRIIVADGEIRRLAQPWQQSLDAVFPKSPQDRARHLKLVPGGKPSAGPG